MKYINEEGRAFGLLVTLKTKKEAITKKKEITRRVRKVLGEKG